MRSVLALLGSVMLGVTASMAAPGISSFTPQAVRPGRETILNFSGSGLQNVSNLWTTFGGKARRLESTKENSVQFAVSCPNIPNGIHALQLAGSDGASDFQLLMVDDLRAQPITNDHRASASALCISPPCAVDSAVALEKSEYYRFHAKAEESVSIEVIAHRIGSEMDPVARVLDTNGRELAFCDDEPGVWRDARFVFRAPIEGDYLLEVHDAAYGGGPKFAYRLRMTYQPLIWFTYPLGEGNESFSVFESIGTANEVEPPRSPADPPRAPVFSTLPSLPELEPNNLAAQAQELSFPVVLNGRIQQQSDLDYFRFKAAKDQRLIFQSQTRSLGSPCDLLLTIKTANGEVLASSDPASPRDAAVTNRFSEAGEYWLEVRELSGNSDARLPYRIKALTDRRGVTASTETNRLEGAPGQSIRLKVSLARFDYPGEVCFQLDPPIEGVNFEKNIGSADKKDTELEWKLSSALKPGDLFHFKMRVVSSPDSGPIFVSTTPALRKSNPLMLNAPTVLEDVFSLAIKSP